MIKTALPTPPHQASPHAAVPGDGAPHIAPNRLVDRPNSNCISEYFHIFILSIYSGAPPIVQPLGGLVLTQYIVIAALYFLPQKSK